MASQHEVHTVKSLLSNMAETNPAFPNGVFASKLDDQPEITLSYGPTESPVRKKTLVGPSVVPNVTGFSQAVIPAGSFVDRHVHASKYETFLCLGGQGKFVVGRSEETSDEDQEIDLEAGCCITVAPQFWHSIRNTGDEDLTVLYFGVACSV